MPPEKKELSQEYPVTDVFPSSKKVFIPITMGGAPNQVLVKPGDTVKKGQIIANGDAFMSVPVHASVSGTVKKITPHLVTANGEKVCVEIDANDSEETDYMPVLDPFTCDKETALKRVKDAGIVGMGGASFPTHVKLNPPKGCVIEHVILNAAECEPYLTIDERTLLEQPDKVVDGMAIVIHITGGKGIIALEENKKSIAPKLEEAIAKANLSDTICVKIVKTKYPQGCEKMLTKALLNKEIPTKGLPAQIGCVISNVGTVCAISDAFRLGKPLIERGLTISGGAVAEPKNIRVPTGTLISDLIPDVIQMKEGTNVAKVISGGPMMGFAMTNAQFPVEKGTSGVLFLTEKETHANEESVCIRCGACLDACPMGLPPTLMCKSLISKKTDEAVNLGLMDCIECGCCSFVCPAHIYLVQRFRVGKSIVRADMAKKAAEAKAKEAQNAAGSDTKAKETK